MGSRAIARHVRQCHNLTLPSDATLEKEILIELRKQVETKQNEPAGAYLEEISYQALPSQWISHQLTFLDIVVLCKMARPLHYVVQH